MNARELQNELTRIKSEIRDLELELRATDDQEMRRTLRRGIETLHEDRKDIEWKLHRLQHGRAK